jgi:hypothetical protein
VDSSPAGWGARRQSATLPFPTPYSHLGVSDWAVILFSFITSRDADLVACRFRSCRLVRDGRVGLSNTIPGILKGLGQIDMFYRNTLNQEPDNLA